MSAKAILTRWQLFLALLILAVLTLLFFYKLGTAALQSYDEAWYAVITRELVHSHNPLLLHFQGEVFTDHPPLGFWLMAIPTTIFGSNEFSVRAVSAFSGVLSIVLLYLLGKRLKNSFVGVGAAVIVLSSMWFMLRARSGNLDIPFFFFELCLAYALLRLRDHRVWFYLTSASFACLLLTKTLVGVGMLPVILLMFWLNRDSIQRKTLLRSLLLWCGIVLPWYVYNQILDYRFLYHHFVAVGTRGEYNSYGVQALLSSLSYLRIGIGKWMKICVLGAGLTVPLFLLSKETRTKLLFLVLWLGGFAGPFLLSSKTEIWHLIPLYAPLALLTSYVLFSAIDYAPKFKQKSVLVWGLTLAMLALAAFQFRQFSNLIYPNGHPFSAEKDISLRASGYSFVYLMGDFYPASVYYSNTKVSYLHLERESYPKMVAILDDPKFNGALIVIPDQRRQLEEGKIPFLVRDQNNNFLIIQSTYSAVLQ